MFVYIQYFSCFYVGLDYFTFVLLTFVVLHSIHFFHYQAKRLAVKNVSEMTFCVELDVKP